MKSHFWRPTQPGLIATHLRYTQDVHTQPKHNSGNLDLDLDLDLEFGVSLAGL